LKEKLAHTVTSRLRVLGLPLSIRFSSLPKTPTIKNRSQCERPNEKEEEEVIPAARSQRRIEQSLPEVNKYFLFLEKATDDTSAPKHKSKFNIKTKRESEEKGRPWWALLRVVAQVMFTASQIFTEPSRLVVATSFPSFA